MSRLGYKIRRGDYGADIYSESGYFGNGRRHYLKMLP